MIIFLFSLLTAITFSVLIKSFLYWKIIALTLILFFLLTRKKDITFGFFKEIFNLNDRRPLYYCCAVFLIFITFTYFEGFYGGQDARCDFLPVARFLALNHFLPQSLDSIEKVPFIRTTYPPVVHGSGAFLFQITGLNKEWIASLVPLTFSFLFLALIFRWSYSYSRNLIIPAAAVFISPFFVNRMGWFYQEAPLTFAVTLLFYCLWRFEKDGKNEYLYSAIAMSSIAMLTKATGIFFSLFLFYFIFSRKLYSKKYYYIYLSCTYRPCSGMETTCIYGVIHGPLSQIH